MTFEDILVEIHELGIYIGTAWEEYIRHFEEPDRIRTYVGEHPREALNRLSARIASETGCRPASPDYNASQKIVALAHLAGTGARDRMTLGIMSGCYDLLHMSHLRAMAHARWVLDGHVNGRLCCLLLSDRNIKDKKGNARPIMDINERLAMVSAVRYVDHAVPLEQPDCITAIEHLRPDLFFKSDADRTQSAVLMEMELVRSLGGSIMCIPDEVPGGLSTTEIIAGIAAGVPHSPGDRSMGTEPTDSGACSG